MDGYFEYKGRRIHFTEQGRGVPVVLVHGYLETSEILAGFAKILSGNHRVLSIDLPGHGLSDPYDEIYSMEFMAGSVASLLDHLHIEKAFVAGHSLGGYITLAFAERYPRKLTGYCLLHSHPLPDDAEKAEKRNAEISLVADGKKNTFIPGNISRLYAGKNLERFHAEVQRSTEVALQIPGDTIIKVLRGMIARPTGVNVIEKGNIPLLWILGTMDNLIDHWSILDKVRLPGNAVVHILNNSGHMGFIEEESEVAEIVSGFISDIQ